MNEYEREIELYDYIEVLLKYKWVILVTTLFCGGLGRIMRPVETPPFYEADVVLIMKTPIQQGSAADVPVTTQSSGFYEALALADDLKQALSDSLDLNLSPRSMDGMLKVEVLDPGIRLTARAHDPDLPIRLVNSWAELFVERNGDLNSEEGNNYYDHVESQYRIARGRLDSTEVELYAFERANRIGFLKIKYAIMDTAATQIYQNLMSTDTNLHRAKLELLVAEESFSSLVPNYRRVSSSLNGQLPNRLSALASSWLEEQLKAAELNLIATTIASLERELAKYPPKLGAVPNPIYVVLANRLGENQIQYQVTSKLLDENPSSAWLDSTHDLNRFLLPVGHYKALKKSFEEVRFLILEKRILQSRFDSLQIKLIDTKDELASKQHNQQRLLRDRELYIGTVESFSKRVEEARIARAKSADDIRVLTRALEVRQLLGELGQQKSALAAGVGLLLSSILSFLIEYVRKAKARRSEAGS
jgi:hypothetical protein